MLTASCSLSELDFARSGSLVKQRIFLSWIRVYVKDLRLMFFSRLKSHPGMLGPLIICTGGSGARFSTLGDGEGLKEGAAELALAQSDPLSLENLT